jgi:hypothetical protein
MNAQLFGIRGERMLTGWLLMTISLIMGVRAAQHRHQRRFPRRWRRSARAPTLPQGERHIAQRPETGKGQANVVHLKAIRCHPPGPLRLIF